MSLVATTTGTTSNPRGNKTRDLKRTNAFGLNKSCAPITHMCLMV